MVRQDGLSEIDQYAIRNIECRVRRLIGRYGITADEREDLVQQLFLEYLERAGGFDASRGRYTTFVNCLIRNQVVSLLRARRHQLRQAVLCPLPANPGEDTDDEMRATNGADLNEDAYRMASGHATRSMRELLELRIDVSRARAALPAELREIGDRVVAEGVNALSQSMGRSPSRIYQLLWKMRPVFAEFGLAPASGGGR